jgi:hypothetical protein
MRKSIVLIPILFVILLLATIFTDQTGATPRRYQWNRRRPHWHHLGRGGYAYHPDGWGWGISSHYGRRRASTRSIYY